MNTISRSLTVVALSAAALVAGGTSAAEASRYSAKCYNQNGRDWCDNPAIDRARSGPDCRNIYVRYVSTVPGWARPSKISAEGHGLHWAGTGWSAWNVGWGPWVGEGGLSSLDLGYHPNSEWSATVHMAQPNTAANVRVDFNGPDCVSQSTEYIG